MPKKLVVHIEYPTGSRSDEIELEDREYDDAELDDLAGITFGNACSYGFEVEDGEVE